MQATRGETASIASAPMRVPGRAAVAGMCCGLFGVQTVWALQNGYTTRIFQTLGARLVDIPGLWIAAPITGLLVQPIVGYLSDRTWGPLGRRRPYMLVGALMAAIALVAMPSVRTVGAVVAALWMLTAAMNVAMEPFRALVADNVPEERRNAAFAMQVGFIGAGAAFASALPYLLVHVLRVSDTAPPGVLPASIRFAYAIGGCVLLLTIGMTLIVTVERPPEALARDEAALMVAGPTRARGRSWKAAAWLLAAAGIVLAPAITGMGSELYFAALLVGSVGLVQLMARRREPGGLRFDAPTFAVAFDLVRMPITLRRLAIVQFFTWFGLYVLWIYAIPVAALRQTGSMDPTTSGYGTAADWVGIQFAFLNAVAAFVALGALRRAADRFGHRRLHAACLLIGAAGLAAFGGTRGGPANWAAPIAIGVAWSSILAMPYAMVAGTCPPTKMGFYMGVHNAFLVLPQLVASSTMGWIVDHWLDGSPGQVMVVASGSFVIAAGLTLLLPDNA